MFAELCITSNFTFLTGASHPEEYMQRAALMGLSAIAVADVNSVAGIVRAFTAAKEIARQVAELDRLEAEGGFIGPPKPPHVPDPPRASVRHVPRLIPAARLVFAEGVELTALAASRTGWATLCRLLSTGRLRAEKGDCILTLSDLTEKAEGLELILHVPRKPGRDWIDRAEALADSHGAQMHLALSPRYDGQDRERLDAHARLAERLQIPTLASAAPLMHHGRRRKMADVLTAIRTGTRVDRLGRAALANAEQRLRAEPEMRRILGPHADAIPRAAALADRCTFDIASLRYEYPSEIAGGETASDRLARLAQEGLKWRYPAGAPDRVQKMLQHELTLIAKLKYEPYFLTVRDIVAFARSRGILCQGRGSAANSITCYALGVTSVSPEIGTMVFERFVSEARDEPPDIDVDFEHERREEVIQHIYETYGRHRAGLCATVIHYRGKRAIREVGAAMGLSQDTLGALSSQLWGFFSTKGLEHERMREIGLDPTDRRLQLTMELIYEIIGFPRHLSQHVGGFIITEGRLDELVPIENAAMEGRTVICWDKDDIDSLGILKVDVLSLGMLTCIRKAFDLIAMHHGDRHTLATLPPEDPLVYDMLCRADSVGVFQVESRAQMNFLPRMRPRNFYDLVIEVAIIRPGPIQGDMVHPYIRRRNGEERVEFPSDELGEVLGKTLGVPLFQEQAMQIAIVGAGFTPEQADRLRRSLATFKKHGNVSEFRSLFLRGMAQKGYDRDFAERCFSQIEGFGSYGFPESHAASFALLVYASAWLKCHYPGIFACALLNSQPMGFYAPAQIVRDAREHGVPVRPVCVNHSYWDNVMEPDGRGGMALRLGFRQIKGLSEDDAAWLTAARGNGYAAVRDVWRRAGLQPSVLARLSEADVFADLGLTRREALWQAKALMKGGELPLFSRDMDGEAISEAAAALPDMTLGEEVVEDYVAMRLSLRAHPVALLRHILTPEMGAPKVAERPPTAANLRDDLTRNRPRHPRDLPSPLERG
ncbi:error-prone DNA polymerase [Antarctobacter jejuensis]|uniref:error-prone DNA polymerase n=1 Tax=Antarctobacter jejuensis TaxID=1439938 RepID=UPI003FCEE7BB